MDVKIKRFKGTWTLVVADKQINELYRGTKERPVQLASIINYFDSGVYSVSDWRLTEHRRPSPYLEGSTQSFYTPENEEEAEYLRSVLHTYEETEEGFSWDSFDAHYFQGDNMESKDKYGSTYTDIARFSYKVAYAKLQEIKTFWEGWSDPDLNTARINNPHRQLSESRIMGHFMIKENLKQKATQEKQQLNTELESNPLAPVVKKSLKK